jgi:two-component system, cell cycle response regulator DivK
MSGETTAHRRHSTAVVLVAEDHETSAEGYAQLLTASGYQVVCAKNGYEALAEVSRAAPSLVILDLKLPKLDGWELLERLKSDVAISHIPIVVVTGDSLPSHHELARSRGAAAVLTKPIRPNDLLNAVRHALSQPLPQSRAGAPRTGA